MKEFCFSCCFQKGGLRKWVLPSVLIKLRLIVVLILSENGLQIFCVRHGKKAFEHVT